MQPQSILQGQRKDRKGMALLSAAGHCSPLLPLAPHPLSNDSLHWMFAPSEDKEQEVEGEQDKEQEDEQEDEQEHKWEHKQEQEQEQDDVAFIDFSNGEPQEAGVEEEGQDLDDLDDATCPSKKRKSF